jgi:hypothetical protein
MRSREKTFTGFLTIAIDLTNFRAIIARLENALCAVLVSIDSVILNVYLCPSGCGQMMGIDGPNVSELTVHVMPRRDFDII